MLLKKQQQQQLLKKGQSGDFKFIVFLGKNLVYQVTSIALVSLMSSVILLYLLAIRWIVFFNFLLMKSQTENLFQPKFGSVASLLLKNHKVKIFNLNLE